MKRLFTFGCSFTNYQWSTWADCLAPEFDYFENWGQAGAGNQYIFNSIVEADLRNNFSNGDTVVVCWTNIYREDRYFKNKWNTLFYEDSRLKSFIELCVDERGCLIRDLAVIAVIQNLLSNKPGVTWKFLSMCDITKEDVWANNDTVHQDIVTLYRSVIDSILPSFRSILRPLGWGGDSPDWIKTRNHDPHPNPEEHLEYLDKVLPGWVTKQTTRNLIAEETRLLESNAYQTKNHIPKRTGFCKVRRL
jgi:hypothetical protein